MELEMQVCSLEQAKKLKELGVEQESLFYHIPWKASDFDGVFICSTCDKGFYHLMDGRVETLGSPEYYSAFTVAELGELIVVDDDDHFCNGGYSEHLGTWNLDLQKRDEEAESGFKLIESIEGETEAECRADMLIYLLENKIITTDTVNASIESKGR